MSYEIKPWREGTLADNLASAGVSRRDFVKYCAGLAAIFAVGTPQMAHAAPAQKAADRKSVV